jgi:hypothetical protein
MTTLNIYNPFQSGLELYLTPFLGGTGGATGIVGFQGPKGDIGLQGYQGDTGIGTTGAQGLSGTQGPQGPVQSTAAFYQGYTEFNTVTGTFASTTFTATIGDTYRAVMYFENATILGLMNVELSIGTTPYTNLDGYPVSGSQRSTFTFDFVYYDTNSLAVWEPMAGGSETQTTVTGATGGSIPLTISYRYPGGTTGIFARLLNLTITKIDQ